MLTRGLDPKASEVLLMRGQSNLQSAHLEHVLSFHTAEGLNILCI